MEIANPAHPEDLDHELDEEYLPEEETLGQRLVGPAAMAASLVALLLGFMAILIQFQEDPKALVITAAPVEDVPEEEDPDEPDPEDVDIEVEEIVEEKVVIDPPEILTKAEVATDNPFKEAADSDAHSFTDTPVMSNPTPLGVGPGGGGLAGPGRGGLIDGGPVGMSHRGEKAVFAALEWLRRHQDKKGQWSLSGYTDQCGAEGLKGRCDGTGLTDYDTGGTGLALLAYTGHAYTHKKVDEGARDWRRHNKFAPTVKRAMNYLKKIQNADGTFGEKTGNFMYNQSIAAFAMADLCSQSGDKELLPVVQRSIDWMLEAQNTPETGHAWRYANYKANPELINEHRAEGGDINDTSVTTWVVMALKTAKDCGAKVDDKGFEGASSWLDKVYDSKSYNSPGTFGYTKKLGFVKGRKYAMTACGMLSRQFMRQSAGVHAGAQTLLEELPDWHGTRDMYYWYYGALAMYQVGGDHWHKWNEAMKPALLNSQNRKGKKSKCLHGSWDPYGTSWGEEYGGRVYSTAIGALTMEVYYRYAKIGAEERE